MNFTPYDFLQYASYTSGKDGLPDFQIHGLHPIAFGFVAAEGLKGKKYDDGTFRDVGQRIVHSYYLRDGQFLPREVLLASDFFTVDYAKCMDSAMKLIGSAKFCAHCNSGRCGLDFGYLASATLMRARDDIEAYKLFEHNLDGESPIFDWQYDVAYDTIADLQHKAAVISEFPTDFETILGLEWRMNNAARVEDYERAAMLRNQLTSLTMVKNPYLLGTNMSEDGPFFEC